MYQGYPEVRAVWRFARCNESAKSLDTHPSFAEPQTSCAERAPFSRVQKNDATGWVLYPTYFRVQLFNLIYWPSRTVIYFSPSKLSFVIIE